MEKINNTNIFNNLINWSKNNYHHLPWRNKRTMYGTLVSEIMLQQTTVGTVLNHFDKFMKRFPTIETLANATHEELAIEWKGLGYYRRARNLKSCAEVIVRDFNGKIPLKREELISIKGIGDYTADALLAIGANQKAVAVDANIERVMARFFGYIEPKGLKLQKKIREDFLVNKAIKNYQGNFSDLNEAIMDLGRVYCQARNVRCENCPLQKNCYAYINKKQGILPTGGTGKKIKKMYELDLLRLVLIKKNKILVYKKDKTEWLAGQWEVPTLTIKTDDQSFVQYAKVAFAVDTKNYKKLKTSITKYKINNFAHEIGSQKAIKDLGFKRSVEFRNINKTENFSTATFKLLKLLGIKI